MYGLSCSAYFSARTTHLGQQPAVSTAADCSPEPTVLPVLQERHPVQVRACSHAQCLAIGTSSVV